jgi:hypothetical protein
LLSEQICFIISSVNHELYNINDLQDALIALKGGRLPSPGSLPSFEEIKNTLGFNRYYEEEKKYVTPAQSSYGSGMNLHSHSKINTDKLFNLQLPLNCRL